MPSGNTNVRYILPLLLLPIMWRAGWAGLVESEATKIPWCYLGEVQFGDGRKDKIGTRFWVGKEQFSWEGAKPKVQWNRVVTGQDIEKSSEVSPCREANEAVKRAANSRSTRRTLPHSAESRETKERKEREEKDALRAQQLDRAVGRFSRGELFSAENDLDDLITRFPTEPIYHFARAALMKLLGRPSDFQSSLDRTLELDPKLAQAPGALCPPRIDPKRKRRIQVHAKDPCLAISDGLIREALGNTEGALKSYSEAIGADPRNWLAYAFRGILRIQLKDCVRGVLDLQRSSVLNPQYKSHAGYYIRQCPQPEAEPAPVEPTPANPFPERAEDQPLPGR